MHMARIYLITIISCCLQSFTSTGQVSKSDTVKREAQITYTLDENQAVFSAITPPLQQIQGAPTAFYTFYWEFGDGHYSTDPKPKHKYKKTGEHKVQLWTTNNYDNGKPPPARPQKVLIKKIAYEDTAQPLKNPDDRDGFRLQINRAPVPDQEIVVIGSYANSSLQPSSGKLYLFYNEQRFKDQNFEFAEVRTHHGERTVQENLSVAMLSPLHHSGILLASTAVSPPAFFSAHADTDDNTLLADLEESRTKYRNSHILEFDNMNPGEERNVFYSLKTTAEMLKDTNAIITIRGVYVPDRGKNDHKVKELEMEIVTSHDPNKMAVSDARLNYRFTKNKELQFKVRFQNNGEGPARSIKLDVDTSPMFNTRSLEVVDMYPKCPVCPDSVEVTYSCLDTLFLKNKIVFHFKNIYLPGSNQRNVEDKDSTKGFVKYKLRFNRKVPKQNSISRTAIIFDKNEPVLTNYSTTRFKPGLSIGARAGYSVIPDLMDSKNYFFGATISPYKSYKGYWQAELVVARHTFTDSANYEQMTMRADGFYDLYDVAERAQFNNTVLSLVPASYRYNINGIVGIGAGVQLSTTATQNVKKNSVQEYYLYSDGSKGQNAFRERRVDLDRRSSTKDKDTFTDVNTALFADVVLGSSRIGPSLGVRYHYYFHSPHVQWQFYAVWKF
jgi:hypothetical protein